MSKIPTCVPHFLFSKKYEAELNTSIDIVRSYIDDFNIRRSELKRQLFILTVKSDKNDKCKELTQELQDIEERLKNIRTKLGF